MDKHCGFSGNSDLYGLGIRVGVYLQWISSQIAVFFRLEGSNDLSDGYLIFQLAMVIAILVLTSDGGAHPVEIVVMLYMIWGGMLCVKGYLRRDQIPNSNLWRLLLGNVIASIMAVYASWFWIKGRSTDRFVNPPCGTTLFLFARIPPRDFGRVSIFFSVLSVYLTILLPWATYLVFYKRVQFFIRTKLSLRNNGDGSLSSLKARIAKTINKEHQNSLIFLIRRYCKVPASGISSARLEEMTYAHLVIIGDNGKTSLRMPLRPYLKTYEELPDRVKALGRMAEREINAGNLDDHDTDSDSSSLGGRFRTRVRRLLRPLVRRLTARHDRTEAFSSTK